MIARKLKSHTVLVKTNRDHQKRTSSYLINADCSASISNETCPSMYQNNYNPTTSYKSEAILGNQSLFDEAVEMKVLSTT